MKEIVATSLATLISTALLLIVWIVVTGPGGLPGTIFPSPIDVLRALYSGLVEGLLWPHIRFTVQSAMVGLLIGASLGVAAGALVVLVPVIEPFVLPIVVGLQSVPKIAVTPIIIACLGFGMASKVFTVALLCFFPLFVSAVAGLRATDQSLLDLYRVVSASKMHVLLNARIPAAAPYLFSGFQIAFVLSLLGCVVAEFIASSRGLGFIIKARSNDLDISTMFAAIVVLSAIGVVGTTIVRLLQRRVVFWLP
ncbi:ABC transporter permease [Bradyrhizobium tropiciagri]|uniref:ABC transporter permease n=1 Tax=Bradyrhizobium tropiciagri TaxID=312253 RepID=UPI001BAD8F98|nr:ABC transporter permease [Bradyrhizobium tropiciagri]MBR0898896.1 ABC transporter permease [Bradyrhizobium tropiciagri]